MGEREWRGEQVRKRQYAGLESRLDQAGFVKEHLLESDLSEENWTRLPFKDNMLIHVKKAFSQGDGGRRKGCCYIHMD